VHFQLLDDILIDQILLWRDHLIPGPALDIGAGDGEISLWLAMHGFKVDALEPDNQQAASLRSRFASHAIHLHMLDVLKFDIPYEHYALIIASAVLHFIKVEQLPALAERLIEGLIPGGMLFAAAFTCDDPSAQVSRDHSAAHVRHYFDSGELRQLFHPLDVLHYEESRRAAPDSTYGYRAGATLVARHPLAPQTP
jgi:cyclopropane fatty-acyl-phospholipid synthase-like methyltransferase